MTFSFRSKLLASHVAVVLVASAIALFTLERALTTDLVRQLDQRLEEQCKGATLWVEGGKRHPDRITARIARIVDAEVSLFGADGTILGASSPAAGADLGPEVPAALNGAIGRATRRRAGQELHYVAVSAPDGTVVRLAQPLSEISATVSAMRRRLLLASALVMLVAILLGVLASRIAARPLQEMTKTASRLARGEFDVPIPEGERDEFGILWRALRSLALQLKGRIGALLDEGERLQGLMTKHQDFVANVSHELRTPVTSIQGYAETLLLRELPRETQTQFLDVIHRQAQRIGALVEQFLALSELETRGRSGLACEPVNLLAVARRVAETVGAHAERRKAKIELGGIAETLDVLAEPDGLERVLLNLVDNAVKYGREGGTVTIGAEERVEEGVSKVVVTVADDGEGIEARHLGRLFERFYRVDTSRSRALGGAGLGLAIVKHVVESLGGTVRVESRLGEGTTFSLTLRGVHAVDTM